MKTRLRISCPTTRKRCFGDKEGADAAIERITKSPRTSYSPVRSYKCPDCGWWHLSSQTRGGRR